LSRFTVSSSNPDVANPNSEVVLLDNIAATTGYHNGGAMHFGPDGMLYLSTGEAGISSNAQDLSKINGKMLRLNVRNYPNSIIPTDNPFYNTANARKEIWAYGLRNPYTSTFMPGSSRLFVNDVGGNGWEEINEILKGKNYGWPTAEGNSSNTSFVNPVYTYSHNGTGAAVTGGAFVTSSKLPAQYQGKYFFFDLVQGFMNTLDVNTKQVSPFATGLVRPLDLDQGADGNLYYLSNKEGTVHRISYVGNANRPPIAVSSADKTNGLAPLTVNFSAAGSSDPDNDGLSYKWSFGDNTSASGLTVTHTYSANGVFSAVVTVTDSKGAATAADAIKITVGNRAPVVTITAPKNGLTYVGGQTWNFSGTAVDPEEGSLPASDYEWSIVFHHNTHTHPFMPSVPGVKSGTFVTPKLGEVDPDQWYRVHLTATDSKGLSATTYIDIIPQKSTFTLASNVAGIQLNLDGSPKPAGTATLGVVGMTRQLSAPASQVVNGQTYQFVSWSDGQAATHNIDTPASNTTYTATYKLASGGGGGGGNGLNATYFNNIDFTGSSISRIDATINFNWGSGSPSSAIGADTFSARWTGKIVPRYSQTYTFYTTSDDGVRLWVNGHKIIDNFTNHAPTTNSGYLTLVAGQKYDIKMEYYENTGGAVAKLEWSSSSQAREIVPSSQLFTA
ncbi:MAG TPA: PQQ-dependent sugar dehydrogenase, partial [Tepidisphaeraceae bacterium]